MSIKLNPIMLALGSLAAIVGGWGLYVMMTRIGGAPPFIGIITIAILELFAVGLAIHAVKVARDGDSPFPFNLGITLIAIVWVVIWILVLVDIVRRRDLTAGKKAAWALLVLILPVIGLIIYMVLRPDQPGERDLPSEAQGSEGFEPWRHGPA